MRSVEKVVLDCDVDLKLTLMERCYNLSFLPRATVVQPYIISYSTGIPVVSRS